MNPSNQLHEAHSSLSFRNKVSWKLVSMTKKVIYISYRLLFQVKPRVILEGLLTLSYVKQLDSGNIKGFFSYTQKNI